ncbi:MAG: flap endonuclease-1 [Sulfolobales archaeon]|nr:flap endonuclease-1 [Sulfolobales archaeon]MCX8208492.1 flap endonuclease-1 [Sulfolobales archaeon]MDW8010029.1 flap endonuclease-1 [Sulfolobales archaeon]
MGVNLRDIIPDGCIHVVSDLRELESRVVAIDAYNALYQFLTAIRQPDGTPLMDSRGRVTSHLSGLFYRTINLLESGIKPVYVFDGKPPELKAREISERMSTREEARRRYEEAIAQGDIEAARKYAQIASHLTSDMVKASKDLLTAMGIPWVQAPSEGEAQAAYMAIWGDVWAVASQDYDSLLFGSPRLIRNLTISGRRKLPRREVYVEVKPELIELGSLLRSLGISGEQLVDIAILIGTDYNPEGVRGVGPKTAYQLVKTHGSLERVLKLLPGAKLPVPLDEIRAAFKNPQVTREYALEWRNPDFSKVREILVEEYEFSEDRVRNALDRLSKASREVKQPGVGLGKWLKKL